MLLNDSSARQHPRWPHGRLSAPAVDATRAIRHTFGSGLYAIPLLHTRVSTPSQDFQTSWPTSSPPRSAPSRPSCATARNASQRSMLRTAVKKVLKAIEAKDAAGAEAAFASAQPMLDRFSSRGLIHKNKAARHKSRLNARIRREAARLIDAWRERKTRLRPGFLWACVARVGTPRGAARSTGMTLASRGILARAHAGVVRRGVSCVARVLRRPRLGGVLAYAIEERHDVFHDRPGALARDRRNQVPGSHSSQLVPRSACAAASLLFVEQQVGLVEHQPARLRQQLRVVPLELALDRAYLARPGSRLPRRPPWARCPPGAAAGACAAGARRNCDARARRLRPRPRSGRGCRR